MSDIISGLKEMDTTTLAILGFAALLLIFLLVLIIITIRVLRSGGEVPDDKKSSYDDDDDEDEEEDEDDEDEDEDEDDEMSRRVREAVESVNETKAKVEAERIAREMENAEQAEKDEAREAAAAKVEEIANAIHAENSGETEDAEEEELEEEAPVGPSPIIGGAPAETEDSDAEDEAADEDGFEETEGEESDEEYSQDDGYEPTPDDADTNELDTTRIRDELKKERNAAKESEDDLNEMARERAEAPEYNASFDSAFVDRPVYEEKVEPVIPNPTPESILGADAPVGPNANMLGGQETAPIMTPEQPAVAGPVMTPEVSPVAGPVITPEMPAEAPAAPAKKKKKKKKKKEVEAPVFEPVEDGKTPRYFWYNQQDVEGLARKEDLYFKSHYFNHPEEVILDLITEMYDCGFVRTEELQRIAYGITFKSLGMKEILHSDESLGFNKESATKEPTEADKQEAYEKWCKYVNNFMEIIVINAPQEVTNYILQKMYDYGNRDIEELMYSPY